MSDNQNNQENEQPKRRRYSGIFDDANDNGGDDVSLESALAASKKSLEPTQPTHETVIIDGDEYDFPIETIETRSFGSEYEIEIYGMEFDTDMAEVVQKLYDAGIVGDDRDDIGIYLRDSRSRSVYVDPSDVGEAVAIINALGFLTDEDTLEDES